MTVGADDQEVSALVLRKPDQLGGVRVVPMEDDLRPALDLVAREIAGDVVDMLPCRLFLA
jgi:hypothetical protein